MKRYASLLVTLMSVLLRTGTVHADVINLNVVTIATGVDVGLQDGVFDEFTTLNLGSVNNNGGTSFRTAFDLTCPDFNQDRRLTPLC